MERFGSIDAKLANSAEFDDESLRLLLRALNTRRGIAFFGAGVSFPYGAPSWSRLVSALEDATLGLLEDHLDSSRRAEAYDPQAESRIRRLEALINRVKPAPDDWSSAEQNLARLELFQLAYQLVKGNSEGAYAFREEIARLTASDICNAQENLRRRLGFFEAGLGITGSDCKSDGIPRGSKESLKVKTSENAEGFDFQEFYNLDRVEEIKRMLEGCGSSSATSLLESLNELIDRAEVEGVEAGRDAWANGLAPDRRSLFCIIFSLINLAATDDDEMRKAAQAAYHEAIPDFSKMPPDSRHRIGTAGEVRPRSDPIAEVAKRLSFWRYLSTNYDFEVERFYEHINYPRGTLADRPEIQGAPFKPSLNEKTAKRFSRGFLGESAASHVLSPSSIGELIDFATCSNDQGARVMHLHGRADQPHTLIATETDYQRRYLIKQEEASAFPAALEIIFSGNPILFMGSSFTEQDLLRPLREFTSRRADDHREVFALMPAVEKPEKRSLMKVEALLRYGVRYLFYGEATHTGASEGSGDGANGQSRDIAFEAPQIAPLKHGINGAFAAIDQTRKHLHALLNDCGSGSDPSRSYRLHEAAANFIRIKTRDESVSEFVEQVFGDVELVETLKVDSTAFSIGLKQLAERLPKDLRHLSCFLAKPSVQAAIKLLIDFLDQLKSKIISATLVLAIRDLQSYQRRWFNDVRKDVPQRRTEDFIPSGRERRLSIAHRQPIIWPHVPADRLSGGHEDAVSKVSEMLCSPRSRSPGRVVYCSSGQGRGKGSFFKALIERMRTQHEKRLRSPRYSHMWVGNLSHSLEFSSVLVGIGNLLRRLGVEAGLFNDEESSYEERRRLGHLRFVEHVCSLLVQESGAGAKRRRRSTARGLIVLGSFDRLLINGGRSVTVEVEKVCRAIVHAAHASSFLDLVVISREVPSEHNMFVDHCRQLGDRADFFEQIQIQAHFPLTSSGTSVGRLQKQIDPYLFLSTIVDALLRDDTAWNKLSFSERAFDGADGDARRGAVEMTVGLAKESWAEELVLRIESSSTANLTNRVIGAVLDQWGIQSNMANGELDFDSRIQFLILKNLSYFGFPTEGHVLFRVPEIRDYLRYRVKAVPDSGPKDEPRKFILSAEKKFEEALEALLSRRLIGAVAPRMRAADRWAGVTEPGMSMGDLLSVSVDAPEPATIARLAAGCRFVLHPSMKRFLQTNFAFRTPERSAGNTFVTSIFAAQPTDVALLASDVQRQVDDMLQSLIEAWRAYEMDDVAQLIKTNALTEGQFDLLSKIARGQRALDPSADGSGAGGAERFRKIQITDAYLFRAKTVRGMLARASADMPACFRAAYGVMRQLRPFSVLVRINPETEDIAKLVSDSSSPFEITEARLKLLLEGIISAHDARLAANEIKEQKGTFDEAIDKTQTGTRGEDRPHPTNTFGPMTEPEEALYPHETAWLWNERGVIALAQGRLYDAIPYFRRASGALRDHEGEEPFGPGSARILLNLAVAEIERGNLLRADEALVACEKMSGEETGLSGEDGDPVMSVLSEGDDRGPARRLVIRPVSLGYRGLVAHLQGDLGRAMAHYKDAIKMLDGQGRARALSIFRKHLGDTLAKRGIQNKAEEEIARALSDAQRMMQFDQMNFVRLSEVRMILQFHPESEYDRATSIVDEVGQYAKRMRLHRLSCEAHFYEARLRMLQGEFELASTAAAESVAIATKYGMKMRRISSSILLGQIFHKKGQPRTGMRLLVDAANAAQKAGYQLALERQLLAIEEAGDLD